MTYCDVTQDIFAFPMLHVFSLCKTAMLHLITRFRYEASLHKFAIQLPVREVAPDFSRHKKRRRKRKYICYSQLTQTLCSLPLRLGFH